MLFSQSLPTLFTLFVGLQQVVATPRYCPPYGPVLPAPRQASQHPAVQYAVDTITTVLKGQTAGFDLSGVSVGVKSIYEDEPLLDFHYTPSAMKPKEGVRKINASTVYRLGSISKVFTVLAALRLAEDGVLSMDDPVTRWIPELAHIDGSHSGDELDVIHWDDIAVGDAAAHLSGLGGDKVSSVWAQLATLNIVEALIPAMDMAARDEAKARFTGQYVDKKTGSALTLSLDAGPGLVLSNWTVRGFDVLPSLNRFQPGRYNDTIDSGIKSIRLYPTGIENKSRAAWRAVFPTLSDTEAEMIEGLTKVKDVTCITWHMLDRFIYNGLSMDHFEFKYGKDGKAVSIKSKAFDVEMKRAEKKT
ncbi:hypothetical protein H9Q70_013730 [Fusarium xylarioides]|nr:hypothetical protein H9Q70_013730 [Fusarium xylarioides]KAG5769062.1 hypothetical protein H9Q73_013669 [Fusarium xylarioides]